MSFFHRFFCKTKVLYVRGCHFLLAKYDVLPEPLELEVRRNLLQRIASRLRKSREPPIQ